MWMVDNRLSQSASGALTEAWQAGISTFVSPVTAWEIGVLASRGRFKSPDPPLRWFERVVAQQGIQLSALPAKVLLESSLLPGTPPRDPADRIIAATAREFGLTVMTRDRALLDYANAGYLNAIPC
jgi:PIN domain nuclease of toxin-antitoxin system